MCKDAQAIDAGNLKSPSHNKWESLALVERNDFIFSAGREK